MAFKSKRFRRVRKVQHRPPEEKVTTIGEAEKQPALSEEEKEERIAKSLEDDGFAVEIREAKLYYAAFRRA